MPEVGELYVKITGRINDLKRSLNQAESESSKAGDRAGKNFAKSFGDKLKGVGNDLMPLSATMATVLGIGTKGAIEFENSMAKIKTVSGASASQMKTLGAETERLAKQNASLGKTANDYAVATLEGIKAGQSFVAAQKSSMASINLSAAANISAADSAKVLSNAMNVFGLEAEKASYISDVLAGAANNASGELSDLMLGFSQGSAVAKQFGMDVSELATAMGLMANAGIMGSDAGTSLKSMLLQLMTPSKEAAKYMKEIGFSAYDSNNQIKDFKQVIADLGKSLEGYNPQQRNKILGQLFGSDGIRAALVMLKDGEKGFKKFEESIQKTGTASDTAGGQFGETQKLVNELKVEFDGFAKEVVKDALPLFRDLLKEAKSLLKWYTDLDPSIKSITTKFVVWGAAIGPVAKGLGTISSGIGGIISMVKNLEKTPIGAVARFLLGIPAGGMALGATAVGSAAMAGYAVNKTFVTDLENAKKEDKDAWIKYKNEDKGKIQSWFNEERKKGLTLEQSKKAVLGRWQIGKEIGRLDAESMLSEHIKQIIDNEGRAGMYSGNKLTGDILNHRERALAARKQGKKGKAVEFHPLDPTNFKEFLPPQVEDKPDPDGGDSSKKGSKKVREVVTETEKFFEAVKEAMKEEAQRVKAQGFINAGRFAEAAFILDGGGEVTDFDSMPEAMKNYYRGAGSKDLRDEAKRSREQSSKSNQEWDAKKLKPLVDGFEYAFELDEKRKDQVKSMISALEEQARKEQDLTAVQKAALELKKLGGPIELSSILTIAARASAVDQLKSSEDRRIANEKKNLAWLEGLAKKKQEKTEDERAALNRYSEAVADLSEKAANLGGTSAVTEFRLRKLAISFGTGTTDAERFASGLEKAKLVLDESMRLEQMEQWRQVFEQVGQSLTDPVQQALGDLIRVDFPDFFDSLNNLIDQALDEIARRTIEMQIRTFVNNSIGGLLNRVIGAGVTSNPSVFGGSTSSGTSSTPGSTGVGSGPVNIVIQATDAASVIQSRHQVAQEMGNAIQDARRTL